MLKLGSRLLERVLDLDPGHLGPEVDCGGGHQAGFRGYREKTVDTVLGAVRLRRAYYSCRECGHGLFGPGAGDRGQLAEPRAAADGG